MENSKLCKCGCGGKAEIIKHTFHKLSPSYGIECTNCHTESWQFYNTEAEAITAWNTAMGKDKFDELMEHIWRDELDTREKIADLVERIINERH